MGKKTGIIVVVVAVAAVLGLVFLNRPKPGANPPVVDDTPSQTAVSVRTPDTLPGVTPGSMMITITKLESDRIYFQSTDKKQLSVTVTTTTKIVKQVNDNGIFKDVAINLSDLKTGQVVEVTTDSTGKTAKMIRLLK